VTVSFHADHRCIQKIQAMAEDDDPKMEVPKRAAVKSWIQAVG
jgi:hypothetical protein